MSDYSDLIVADGQNDVSPPETRRSSGRGVWILLGLAIGLGVAGLFASSVPRPAGSETTSTSTTPTSLGNRQPTVGIGEVIPGFPDGLNVLVAPGGGRAFDVVTWPLDGPPLRRSIPLGDRDTALGSATFDVSGHHLAALIDTGGGQSMVTGTVNSLQIIDSDVLGFAWHDSQTGDLAWTTSDGGQVSLHVSGDGGAPEIVVDDLGVEALLTAFGEWGFALTDAEIRLAPTSAGFTTRVLGRDGESMFTTEGQVVASQGAGTLVVRNESGLTLLRLADGAEPVGTPLALSVDGVAAALSPNGQLLAVSGFQGMEVIDVVGGEQVETYPVRLGNGATRWSSDSRFLVVPGFSGILVIDTESGEIHTVLANDGTRAAGPTPLSDN